MSKKTYTPDIKGVTQWLKDNPTRTNRRGRTLINGLRQAYKATGYEGVPLKIKEGNLTSKRHLIRLSPRGDNGDTARAASSNPYTQQEFIDYGKKNGYSTAHSIEVFKEFQEKNKAQKASINPGQANDHVSPNGSKYYSAGENFRNRVGLSPKVNGFKSDKMPTPSEMRERGIPTTRSSLIQKEFNNIPPPDPKELRSLASQVARDPSRIRARVNNQRLDDASARRIQRMQELIDKPKSKPKPKPKPKSNKRPRSPLSIGGSSDIPEIQNQFDLVPAFGTPLGGGRTIDMADFSIGTV